MTRIIGRKLYGPLPQWQPKGQPFLEWHLLDKNQCSRCLRRDCSTLEDPDGTILAYICENCGHQWNPRDRIWQAIKTISIHTAR